MSTENNKPIEKEIGGITVVYATPPVWDNVVKTFQVIPASVVFTYGNKIYNPSGSFLPEHIMQHEKVHMNQQARLVDHAKECTIFSKNTEDIFPRCSCGKVEDGAALWWGKFLRDKDFRLDQESEAYGIQYAFVCASVKDRNQRHRFLMDISRVLASAIYGHCISIMDAMTLIKNKSGVK